MSATNHFWVPQRAMVIAAHPDDIEFGVAGTVARWTDEGAEVCYVLVTSGDVGIADPSLTREQVREIREPEQRAAARVVGVHEVVFLREPDGEIVNTLDLRRKLVREIRRFRPDAVICNDPTILFASEGYINHPDHRAVAMAALDAVFPAAGQPHVFEDLKNEGLSAHKTKKVYVSTWSAENANTWVNITSTIDRKIEALMAHKSQMDEMESQRAANTRERISGWLRQGAAERGKGREMAFAEQFRVITLEPDPEENPEQNHAE